MASSIIFIEDSPHTTKRPSDDHEAQASIKRARSDHSNLVSVVQQSSPEPESIYTPNKYNITPIKFKGKDITPSKSQSPSIIAQADAKPQDHTTKLAADLNRLFFELLVLRSRIRVLASTYQAFQQAMQNAKAKAQAAKMKVQEVGDGIEAGLVAVETFASLKSNGGEDRRESRNEEIVEECADISVGEIERRVKQLEEWKREIKEQSRVIEETNEAVRVQRQNMKEVKNEYAVLVEEHEVIYGRLKKIRLLLDGD